MVIELDWLKKKVNNIIIERDWLNMLMDTGENKVTSLKLTKYDFATAYLDAWVLLRLLMVMLTWIKAVDENGYDFDAYE